MKAVRTAFSTESNVLETQKFIKKIHCTLFIGDHNKGIAFVSNRAQVVHLYDHDSSHFPVSRRTPFWLSSASVSATSCSAPSICPIYSHRPTNSPLLRFSSASRTLPSLCAGSENVCIVIAPARVSTCRSKNAKGEWVEKVYDYVKACSSVKISDMQVKEDFESRPHKAVTS